MALVKDIDGDFFFWAVIFKSKNIVEKFNRSSKKKKRLLSVFLLLPRRKILRRRNLRNIICSSCFQSSIIQYIDIKYHNMIWSNIIN